MVTPLPAVTLNKQAEKIQYQKAKQDRQETNGVHLFNLQDSWPIQVFSAQISLDMVIGSGG